MDEMKFLMEIKEKLMKELEIYSKRGNYTISDLEKMQNYREKREETLRKLAAKMAAKVKKTGRNIALEPMNAYERRIIHAEIQKIEGVTTHSIGTDTERRVVISVAK